LLPVPVLLLGVWQIQNSLNHDREALGLTRVQPLENAPPVLAFTTVALGGFRGLISNLLWIRANSLQDEDKYFEMVQLADWITKLEPHFVQVWIFQEWNMAWNISVKFKDYADRWRWVQRGIDLIRDEGLRYNPNEILLYRELAWIFQDKMGAVTDDANMYYKQQWADEMAEVFGKKTPNLDELIDPKTDDQKRRAALLRDKFKLDPRFMKQVDQQYGPLEWRLPEAHAIYWAALGLDEAKRNPGRVNQDDLITLRRVLFQSSQLSFHRGRMEPDPIGKTFRLGPNLDIVGNANRIYEEQMADDAKNRDYISTGHRNFLRTAVYFLYVNNRRAEAERWFKYLAEKYPNKPILDNDPNSLPRNLTLDQYAVGCVQEDVKDTSPARTTAIIEGLLTSAYTALVLDQEDRYAGLRQLAHGVYTYYQSQIPEARMAAMSLGPYEDINQKVVVRLLNPESGLLPEYRAILRTRLNIPNETASTNAAPVLTNAVPATPPAAGAK